MDPKSTKINKEDFEGAVTSMGDVLDEVVMDSVVAVTDPQKTGVMDVSLLAKTL